MPDCVDCEHDGFDSCQLACGRIVMDYLKRAERYAEARGDDMWFKNLYTGFRQYNGVTDSVWKTLNYLYGSETATELECHFII